MAFRIRIGTRKIVMALPQTEEIARRLTAVAPDVDVEIVKFETAGDSDQTSKNRRPADELAATQRAKLDADLMGQSYSEIARHLNDAGIITVTGRKFYPLTVKNYVRPAGRRNEKPHMQYSCMQGESCITVYGSAGRGAADQTVSPASRGTIPDMTFQKKNPPA